MLTSILFYDAERKRLKGVFRFVRSDSHSR
jgi:hypothetical protein